MLCRLFCRLFFAAQYFFFSLFIKYNKFMTLSDTSRMFFSCCFFLFFCHFLFNTKSTGIFVSACPLGCLLFIQKLKKNGSTFWTSCFWFSQGEVETCYKTSWKTTGSSWKLVVHLFQMWKQQYILYHKTGQICWWGNDCTQRVSWLSQ